MCLAIPVRVNEINGTMARIELDGILRDVSLALTPEARVGDYVLIHTGYAISVLDEAEAQETLKLFDELAEASRLMDEELAAEGGEDEASPSQS
jgi:hydrogenase expression/formation protein HypC